MESFEALVDEELTLSLAELCRACSVSAEEVLALVEEGLVEPVGDEPARWQFSGVALRRIRIALRLQRDLRVNREGVALAIELLDELRFLRARVRRLEQLLGE